MADQDILHTTEIMKAALPYLSPGTKGMAELLVKAFDLMGSLTSKKSTDNLAACGLSFSNIDMEGLLNGIRPICNKKERDIIDRILGFFNMKRMFETYNKMMEAMKTMQEFGGFPFGDSTSEDFNDTVTSNFSTSNFESIFKAFQNSSTSDESSTASFEDNNTSNHNDNQETSSNESTEQNSGSTNFGNRSNNMMFEMLKTMVPPEQVSTFENLSMLLNTMSYDNNSRPDNKEQTDG